MAALLELENLCVDFRSRRGLARALDGVSLTLQVGEVLGLVGESGAGKSLTGAAMLGLLEPPAQVTSGHMRVDGRSLSLQNIKELAALRGRHIGAIFQDPQGSLNPLLTVGQQLIETLQTHLGMRRDEARDEAVQLLRRTGIPTPEARLEQYPHQFSGGMRQRVVIALALAGRPRILIADEPTTALDVSIQAQVIELLRSLARGQGMAVLLVTHDMGVIAETCDRVAVLYAGRLAEVGPVHEVLFRPAHPYTQGLMGTIPSLEAPRGQLLQIEGAMPRPGQRPEGCAFHPRCTRAEARCRAGQPPALQAAGDTSAACWVAADAVRRSQERAT